MKDMETFNFNVGDRIFYLIKDKKFELHDGTTETYQFYSVVDCGWVVENNDTTTTVVLHMLGCDGEQREIPTGLCFTEKEEAKALCDKVNGKTLKRLKEALSRIEYYDLKLKKKGE